MVGAEHRGLGRRSQSLAQLERDAALVRVSRARRWMIVAAGALSAAFAALVSAITPGHSLNAKAQTLAAGATGATRAPSSGSAARPSATRMPPLASPADLGLQGPSQDPQAAGPDPSQAQPQAQSQPVQPDPSQQAAPNPAVVAPAPAVVSGGS